MDKNKWIAESAKFNPTVSLDVIEARYIELVEKGYIAKPKTTTKTLVKTKEIPQEAINVSLAFLEHKKDYTQIKALLRKKDSGEIAIDWAKDVVKLNELDWLTYPQITEICKFVCVDEFWSRNILSIPKLRKKNREWVPYWAVMIDAIKGDITAKKENEINEVLKKKIRSYRSNLNKEPSREQIEKWKEKIKNWEEIN